MRRCLRAATIACPRPCHPPWSRAGSPSVIEKGAANGRGLFHFALSPCRSSRYIANAVIVSFRAGLVVMRAVWLVAVAIQLGLACPAYAQAPISEKLPLFAKNHCDPNRDSATQLF